MMSYKGFMRYLLFRDLIRESPWAIGAAIKAAIKGYLKQQL